MIEPGSSGRYSSLNEYKILKKALFDCFLLNENAIERDINNFCSSKKIVYRIIEYSDDFCLVMRKGLSPEMTANIGYPFPVYAYAMQDRYRKFGISINVYLRGEPVRNIQREYLFRKLLDSGLRIIKETQTTINFRNTIERLCNTFKKCSYYDPYSFVGDSFIGLYFLENFLSSYNLDCDQIYSNSHNHLRVFGGCVHYDSNDLHGFSGLAIIPDLLDQQWERTVNTLKKIAIPGNVALIIGRNLAIEYLTDNIKIYQCEIEDPLLRNRNIEDYMNDCLLPFLFPERKDIALKPFAGPNIIINPFGSIGHKTISVKLIVEIIAEFIKRHPDGKVIVIAGLSNIPRHLTYIAKLQASIKNRAIQHHVLIRYYDSFVHIFKDIEELKISTGITSDTSIAHFFNLMGLKNITFYNIDRCDLLSHQSLASDSPLGFCRYGISQYPVLVSQRWPTPTNLICDLLEVLMGKKKLEPMYEFMKTVSEAAFIKPTQEHKALLKLYHKTAQKSGQSWLTVLYNPDVLVHYLNDNDHELIKANWHLNLVYKLGRGYND